MHYADVIDIDPECQLLLVGQVSYVHTAKFMHHRPIKFQTKNDVVGLTRMMK